MVARPDTRCDPAWCMDYLDLVCCEVVWIKILDEQEWVDVKSKLDGG